MTRSAIFIATILAAAAAHSAPLATEGFVTNKIAAAISQIPPPDFSTNNTELVATIRSNPWGFALTNDFVRKTGDVMTGSMTIAYDGNLLSIYPDSIYFSGETGVNYIYWPDNIYGSGEIGYDDLHYRGGFDIFATREWADHWAHATVSDAVPAWARAATKPAYTAAEVGAYSTNETMYVDWIGDIGCIYGDYMPSGVWDFGDGCIRIASWYQFNLHMPDSRQADGIEIFDTADPTIKTVIPINGSDVATIADIPDVPASVSNTVTIAYVREKLGVWMEYDEATGFYYYCHEEE